jgi:hypothetical protein
VGYSRSEGDGGASFVTEDAWYGTTETYRRTDGIYNYDGTVRDISAETAIGYVTRPVENVLVAFAVQGSYHRVDFEEIGPGNASLDSNGNGISRSDYGQWHDRKDDIVRLNVPVALEWSFHKYAKLRLGLDFFAERQEADYLFSMRAAVLEAFSEIPGFFPLDFQDRDLRATTDVIFSNGLEININDRFVLDLQGGGSYSSVNLTSFGYISARYTF